jgi:hypothetical protein
VWTPYPELDEVLAAFVAGVQEVLVENLVGIYLQGSFAVGDADEWSDVDFVVVTETQVTEDDAVALQVVQERVYAMPSTWAQHLEGSYFTREQIRRFDPARTPLLYFDNGATERARDNHCNTAVVRWSLREHGITLTGPDPKELVDPVPAEVLRDDARWALSAYDDSLAERSLVDWSRRFQGLLVLSICRILHTLECGRVTSKPEAGEWALRTLPAEWTDLIRLALDDRPDPWVKVEQQADRELLARSYAFLNYALSSARS